MYPIKWRLKPNKKLSFSFTSSNESSLLPSRFGSAYKTLSLEAGAAVVEVVVPERGKLGGDRVRSKIIKIEVKFRNPPNFGLGIQSLSEKYP